MHKVGGVLSCRLLSTTGVLLLLSCSSSDPKEADARAPAEDAASADAAAPADAARPLPEEAYAAVADGLPAGAKLVSREEFESLARSEDFVRVSIKALREQQQAAAAQEATDDQTIQAFLAANPAVKGLAPTAPDPSDPTVAALPDGNYLHTIKLASGAQTEVVTMGLAWSKRAVARAIEVFPTRDNQLAIYRQTYVALPKDISGPMVDPDVVAASPDKYDAEAIGQLNKSLLEQATQIIGGLNFDTQRPAGYVEDCDEVIGAGNGSDCNRCSYTDPTCGFQADGIRNRYDWPMKYYVSCPKDQHGRGTCTGMANTSAVEYLVALKLGKWVNLSDQAVYNRAKLKWERMDYGDGIMSDFLFAKIAEDNWLIPFENQWPYNPSASRIDQMDICIAACAGNAACQDNCRSNTANHRYARSCDGYTDTCSDSTHQSEFSCMELEGSYYCGFSVPEKNPNFRGYRIGRSAQIWDAADVEMSFLRLIVALALRNPVVIGHPITTSFDDADTDGFMSYLANDTNRGGHGMHVVGYIDNPALSRILPDAPPGEGGGYFIVKNSWSNCWGDGGYIYIPYQSVKTYTPDATVLYDIQL